MLSGFQGVLQHMETAGGQPLKPSHAKLDRAMAPLLEELLAETRRRVRDPVDLMLPEDVGSSLPTSADVQTYANVLKFELDHARGSVVFDAVHSIVSASVTTVCDRLLKVQPNQVRGAVGIARQLDTLMGSAFPALAALEEALLAPQLEALENRLLQVCTQLRARPVGPDSAAWLRAQVTMELEGNPMKLPTKPLKVLLRDLAVFVCGLPDTESARMAALQILTDVEEVLALLSLTWEQALPAEAAALRALRQLLFAEMADLPARLPDILAALPRPLLALQLLRRGTSEADWPEVRLCWGDDASFLKDRPRPPAAAAMLATVLR